MVIIYIGPYFTFFLLFSSSKGNGVLLRIRNLVHDKLSQGLWESGVDEVETPAGFYRVLCPQSQTARS